jgi:hypothetical protein
MKKADKPSTNAIQSAADRMKRGVEYSDEDLWKDDPDESPAKPAETSDDTPIVSPAKPAKPNDSNHTVLRQRRRSRGRKS